MAVLTNTVILPTNNTDADFRAWAQYIHDLLVTTGGWVQTADTGQVDLTTVLKPTVTNTKMGYRIYRMNDTLQATSPVFLRFDFGSGAAALTPGLWMTIGTGSDGAGTVTTIRYNGGASATPGITPGGNTAVAGGKTSYGSASPSRFVFSLWTGITPSYHMVLGVERSKHADGSGAETGDGLILAWTNANAVRFSQYVVLGATAQPAQETGLFYVLSATNPSAFGSDVGVGVHCPMRGYAQQPATQWLVVRANDFVAEATITVTLYGELRTYQHLNTVPAYHGTLATNDSNSRACIRLD